MRKAVFLFPGFPGSQLWRGSLLGGQILFWINPSSLAAYGPYPMTLASDGVSPALGAFNLSVFSIVPGYYDNLIAELKKLGYDVYAGAWDFRKSLANGVAALASQIDVATQSYDQVWGIAHSHGGLMQQLVFPSLLTITKFKWQGSVYAGTPFGGSYTVAQAGFGTGPTFNRVQSAMEARAAIIGLAAWPQALIQLSFNTIKQCIVSWPGLWEMLPFVSPAWASLDPQAVQLFTAGNYHTDTNPQQQWLDAAKATQLALDGVTQFPPKETVFISTGVPTIDNLVDSNGPVWHVSTSGDGTVTRTRAIPNRPIRLIECTTGINHGDLLSCQEFLERVGDILASNLPPSFQIQGDPRQLLRLTPVDQPHFGLSGPPPVASFMQLPPALIGTPDP